MSRRRNPGPGGSVTGLLVVDKPAGMTSHDVVAQVRRAFRTRRVGHAGTLDPMATGVLVVLLGEATKLSSVLTTQRKEYGATLHLGIATDSFDADGRVTSRRPVPADLAARLGGALRQEKERTLQVPPAVSAIKVGGKRSYQLARAGTEVDLEPRAVQVHELDLVGVTNEEVTLRLVVSKGYYVRALARDLAASLGTVGHLTALRRLQSGTFSLEGAVSLPLCGPVPLIALEQAARQGLSCVEVSAQAAQDLALGRPIGAQEATLIAGPEPTLLSAALHDGRLLALVEFDENTRHFHVRRGILDVPESSDTDAPAD